MCLRVSPDAMRSRLIQPKLSPPLEAAVLVMTRPWSLGQTAMRALLVRSGVRMTTSVWRFRNATSSMNVDDVHPAAVTTASARAIRRYMDVAYRIRPLAGRIRLLCGRRERADGSRSRSLPDAPRGGQVAEQLPRRDHEDRLLDARRLE